MTRTTNRPITLVALLLSAFMSAMEMTVVATAMPTVVADLGGLELYAWVFAAYLVATTVTTPMYGKLADLFGRKPVMLFGLCTFLVGSLASGFAPSMPWLIALRALQGIGAGAMQPISLTIVGDIYSVEERARMQGIFGSVWGFAGLAGPVLGSLIVQHLSWRWVFWINVPFGLAAIALLVTGLHEKVERRAHVLDLPGAATLAGAIVLLLVGTHGGAYALPVLGGALGLAALFVWIERAAPEPLLPLDLFHGRLMAVASLTSTLVGGAMLSTVTYVPLFVQGVLGGSPEEAAKSIAPMVVGWPIASALSGRIVLRVGVRPLVRTGLGLTASAALGLMLVLHPGAPAWPVGLLSAAFGAGLGLANTALLLAVQTSVPWKRRGVATASSMFFRTIGGTLAVGALGALLAATLARDPTIPAHAADALLGPGHGRELAPAVMQHLSRALADGLGAGFQAIFGIAAAAFGASLALPDVNLKQAQGPGKGPDAQPEAV